MNREFYKLTEHFLRMNKIEKTVLKTCGYTVLILTLFYTFVSLSDLPSTALPLHSYFLTLLFSGIVSLDDLLFDMVKAKKWIQVTVHYITLLVAFLIIFVLPGGSVFGESGAIVAITCFTLLYALCAALVLLFRKLFGHKESEEIKSKSKKAKENEKYTPHF